MGRRAKREPITPPPVALLRDESLTGSLAQIRNERGVYKIVCKETNEETGVSWFVLYGGAAGHAEYRHRYARDVSLGKGRRKYVET